MKVDITSLNIGIFRTWNTPANKNFLFHDFETKCKIIGGETKNKIVAVETGIEIIEFFYSTQINNDLKWKKNIKHQVIAIIFPKVEIQ